MVVVVVVRVENWGEAGGSIDIKGNPNLNQHAIIYIFWLYLCTLYLHVH